MKAVTENLLPTTLVAVSNSLNAEKALIFRIVHRDNVGFILDHGVHCGSSATRDPEYVSIGNADLIVSRTSREIPLKPGGTLSNYVPFYFTPYSPMLLNIKTGYNGITKRSNYEIVILVSSLHRLKELKVPFVFSDRHDYLNAARFSSKLSDLDRIDWKILQNRDFKRDVNDLEKMERYQAEALVYECCPMEAIVGIACYDDKVQKDLATKVSERKLKVETIVRPGWYF